MDKLAAIRELGTPFTMIVDDPMSNSYIQNPHSPADDPQLIIEEVLLSLLADIVVRALMGTKRTAWTQRHENRGIPIRTTSFRREEVGVNNWFRKKAPVTVFHH